VTDREWPRLDVEAARSATLAAVLAAALLVAGQQAVVAAATDGHAELTPVESVPAEPSAQQWGDAERKTLTLRKQSMALPYGGGSVTEATVSTVTNESHVAIRVAWSDPTNDTSIAEPRAYSDAVAVMVHGGATPPITMGATGDPVDIWYWRASWQFTPKADGGSMYAYPHPDQETRPGAAAGNPLSRRTYDRYAQNYYAKGYGSLSHAPEQPVAASAERTDDGWAVVFVRERTAGGEYSADFADSDRIYLTVAVWNGSADEVNGQKSLSYQFLALDTESGALSQADPASGDGGDAGGGGEASGGGGGSGDQPLWIVRSMTNMVGSLVVVCLLTWFVAYWRVRS